MKKMITLVILALSIMGIATSASAAVMPQEFVENYFSTRWSPPWDAKPLRSDAKTGEVYDLKAGQSLLFFSSGVATIESIGAEGKIKIESTKGFPQYVVIRATKDQQVRISKYNVDSYGNTEIFSQLIIYETGMPGQSMKQDMSVKALGKGYAFFYGITDGILEGKVMLRKYYDSIKHATVIYEAVGRKKDQTPADLLPASLTPFVEGGTTLVDRVKNATQEEKDGDLLVMLNDKMIAAANESAKTGSTAVSSEISSISGKIFYQNEEVRRMVETFVTASNTAGASHSLPLLSRMSQKLGAKRSMLITGADLTISGQQYPGHNIVLVKNCEVFDFDCNPDAASAEILEGQYYQAALERLINGVSYSASLILVDGDKVTILKMEDNFVSTR